MKTLIAAGFVSFLAAVPTLLSAQLLRDTVPLRHWPAPLYWQPDLAELDPLAATPTQPNPLTFIGMTPCRVVDTRTGSGFTGAFGSPSLVGGVGRTFPLQSSTTCSIPAGAQAYSLNITVVPPGSLGFISVWPTGQPHPVVSTLNDLTGTIVANAAIVPAGTSGSIDVYASNNTDVVIDINGYYAASFGTPSGGYQFPNASGTPLMTIAPTGNVGIGTASPGSVLDVAGDINYSGAIRQQGSIILQMQQGTSGYSLAVGLGALAKNSASYNTATGWQALNSNTTGAGNTAVGSLALLNNTTGENNTAIGDAALYSSTTGSSNTSVGVSALSSNGTGANNTAIGYQALLGNNAGQNNIALGYTAGSSVTTGSNNIHIGTQGSSTDTTTIRIGGNPSLGDPATQTQFFASGIRGATTANNDAVPVVIDSAGQLGTVSSSRRFKEDIQDMADGSNGLMRLRPVTFRYQKPFADGSKPIQYGLIAEEVAEVYPDLVAHSTDGKIETVKYQVLDSMLLNEVQRQDKEIGSQQVHIKRLEDELSDARRQNQTLQERLSRLEAVMAKAAGGAGVQ